MRHNPTGPEHLLWLCLRGSQLGVGFRRQVVIGHYIVDFLAPSRKLVVEVDGAFHASRVRLDAKRQARLQRAGYRFVRASAEEVMAALPVVVERIAAALV